MLRSLVGSEMCIRDRYTLGIINTNTWMSKTVKRALEALVVSPAWIIFSTLRTSSALLSPQCTRLPTHFYRTQQTPPPIAPSSPITLPSPPHSLSTNWTTPTTVTCPQTEVHLFCCHTCLLYTSDAADEEDSVDLGGRRIIKKKKKKKK
eukprot:TRINITY_DN12334_c0_g1_i2.p1 TRINITY_DN12334_c0_g1~~TRINITY_DN12334_c0_g1_i2.p1  ORF type:complete len:149 (+),score=31.60 TRINITY_DN12334_c0_g1_i2:139-585(+)